MVMYVSVRFSVRENSSVVWLLSMCYPVKISLSKSYNSRACMTESLFTIS